MNIFRVKSKSIKNQQTIWKNKTMKNFTTRTGMTGVGIFCAMIIFVVISHSTARQIAVPSPSAPSIMAAMGTAQKGDTIVAANGTYSEQIVCNPGVYLKSKQLFGAVIKGDGRGVVVRTAVNSGLEGFEIRDGTIGVYSQAPGVRIVRCRIVNNTESGIMCIGHVAHIQDNVIAFNGGSGIQGWDVRSTAASINHNTIAYNENHGISLGGLTSVIVENNIIAHNKNFGIKTVTDSISITAVQNSFYNNNHHQTSFTKNNFLWNPYFVQPRAFNFSLGEKSRCRDAASDNDDIGARLP
jgi:hypothetical protein